MSQRSLMTRDPSGSQYDAQAVRDLAEAVTGPLLQPGDADYDRTRAVWNGMIDRRPGLIARCRNARDVAAAVNFARGANILVSVRGGDHNAAGNAVCDGGLMIDLSLMQGIEVDAETRTARAEPGVRWASFDQATQAHGLATTGGTVSDTGIAGLTLGGGLGWLAGKHGLTCDNLLEVEVVTADGHLVRASQRENANLFWALRGGSGNFGVVTAFTFQLHPVGPTVVAGLVAHPLERAAEVLRFYRDFADTVPDEVNTAAVRLTTPDGVKLIAIAACSCGPIDAGEEALQPLRDFGPPVLDQIGPVPYIAFQQGLDPSFPRGRRYYWKSLMMRELSDDAIAHLVEVYESVSSPMTAILLQQVGNAARRVPVDSTAFAHRDARWDLAFLTGWEDPTQDLAQIAWTRQSSTLLRPFSTGGAYVNGVADGDPDEITGAYGANYRRLAALKAEYDPTNLFRVNANIDPRTAALPSPDPL
jgi:FAD/FMN-containing dehydrogenase